MTLLEKKGGRVGWGHAAKEAQPDSSKGTERVSGEAGGVSSAGLRLGGGRDLLRKAGCSLQLEAPMSAPGASTEASSLHHSI